MYVERIQSVLRALPHAEETRQWRGRPVFWAGDRAAGGKMFAILGFDDAGSTDKHNVPALSLHVGRDHYYGLIEQDGIVPAPYLARAHWVLMEKWHELYPGTLRPILRTHTR